MKADKPDSATAAIVEELRARGYHVEYAHSMPFDLLVIGRSHYDRRTMVILAEIKAPGKTMKFTRRELEFQAALKARGFSSAYTTASCAGDIMGCFGDT